MGSVQSGTALSRVGSGPHTFIFTLSGRPPGPSASRHLRANAARNALHDRFEELMEAHPEGTPAVFAQELSVPLLTLEDSELWTSLTTRISSDLVERLMESGPDIPGFFRTLPSGQYAQNRGS